MDTKMNRTIKLIVFIIFYIFSLKIKRFAKGKKQFLYERSIRPNRHKPIYLSSPLNLRNDLDYLIEISERDILSLGIILP